jgi:integrase
MDLLGSIMEHAFMGGHISANPSRRVKKARPPRREEVQALSPGTIEAMRQALDARDATLISVLSYAGLRPGEALGRRWGDVREQTLLVQRAISLGEEADTKTRQHPTVRLLAWLAADLRAWRMAAGRPDDCELVFPGKEGQPWTQAAYQSWRRRAFSRATLAAGLAHARPPDLRHSFASLLLHEGRSVTYVARQLGHDPRLTLTRYGPVIDELEDSPRIEAEAAIANARLAVRATAPAAMPELGS